MKKKIFLALSVIAVFACIFAISVSAAVTTYDDAPAKEKLTVSTDDVVVFDDGFTCPSAYIFKDTDTVSAGDHTGKNGLQKDVDFSYINEKTGKSYDVSKIVELDIPEGMKTLNGYGFTRLTIKRISIPKTVTTIGGCCFEKCASLEECVFEHTEDSELSSLPAWIFQGCTSLKAFSFPECITAINSEYEFSGCTSLTAVYLPSGLTTYTTSGNDQKSVFWNCTKMYFVNEPFTYDNIPEKPSVYYLPSGLTTMSGELFKKCKNLNETIVFPAGVTQITNSWAFETGSTSTVKNVVFLGDMIKLNTSNWKLADGAKIIFANANDTGSSSLESLSGGHTKIYCASETDISKHVVEKTVSTEATCEENKATTSYCFCGKVIEAKEVEGTKLGHSHTIFIDLVYADFSKAGYYSYECERCGNINNDKTADALLVNKGYSAAEYAEGGMSIGFKVNEAAVAAYEEIKGETVSYGVFAVLADTIGDNDIFDESGNALAGVIAADITDTGYSLISLKMFGISEDQKDIDLAMGAYVKTVKGETTKYAYLQEGQLSENGKYVFASYNDVAALVAAKEQN